MPNFYHLEESDGESSFEFEKVIERIHTPISREVPIHKETSESEDEDTEFLKFIERIRTPHSITVASQKKTSESEDEELEFRKFSERIRTSHLTNISHKQDSNSVHAGCFSEKRKLTYSEDNHISANVVKDTEKISLSQIVPSQLEVNYTATNKTYQTGKDTSRSNEIHHAQVIISSDSDDEELEFLKFSERIYQTPQNQSVFRIPESVTKNLNKDQDDDDDDEVFLNLSENLQKLCTPRSQNRNNARSSIVPNSYSKKQHSSDSLSKVNINKKSSEGKSGQHSLQILQSRNKEEFNALFSTVLESSISFSRKREKYAQQLFDFFNRKVFDYKLPKDMPLIWDNLLTKTAGLTICSRKNNVYSCSIKLSSKLLISFDRLQDTLLHEMCHAAVWIINNIESVSHGPLWRIWGSRCKMILPFIECPEKCHNYDVPYKIWYQCLSCNWKKGKLRHSQKLANSICKKCKKPVTVTRS